MHFFSSLNVPLFVSGLILSPTFLTQLQAQTTSGFPHTVPVNLTEDAAALKESSTKPTLFGEVENEPEGTGKNQDILFTLRYVLESVVTLSVYAAQQ